MEHERRRHNGERAANVSNQTMRQRGEQQADGGNRQCHIAELSHHVRQHHEETDGRDDHQREAVDELAHSTGPRTQHAADRAQREGHGG
ncbi:MAG: hypothetical protein B7733_26170 [Myxococcales bacterium FL481]|nr:MAG: hypothetical protein B7733_26170 [Myxococcales bacterium FL481]